MGKDEPYRTSWGQFAETEEAITNLLAAVEHIQDQTLDEESIKLIKTIRDIRAELIKKLFPEETSNIGFHCAYKHLLLAKTQLRETMQSLITYGEKPYKEEELLANINEVLGTVRAKYANIDPSELESPTCSKCSEDYAMNKSDIETKNETP